MRSSSRKVHLAAFPLILALTAAVFGQVSNPVIISITTETLTEGTGERGNGQKLKVEGIVTKSDAGSFTLRGPDGKEREVVLTNETSIKTVRRFALDRTSSASDILRGLRLKAEGRINSDGQLVAKKIRFDEQDLRVAQALESRVDPVESQAKSTEVLAQSNEKRIDTAEQRIGAAEENAQQLAGQIEEVSGLANRAGAAATNAQATADQAQSNANVANQRIDSLDDYKVFQTVTVRFKSGSARLSRLAKTEIDEAMSAINENLKGWIVVVEGYADSRGRTAKNRSLSERRANVVINYLVTKHRVPIRRVVQPFGYGSSDPIASNKSRAGRSVNRRAEITLLVNQGISSQAGQQTASEDSLSRP